MRLGHGQVQSLVDLVVNFHLFLQQFDLQEISALLHMRIILIRPELKSTAFTFQFRDDLSIGFGSFAPFHL